MTRLTFSESERQALRQERFEHPHPRVQKRMDVLWYLSLGETYFSAARLGDVSEATVDRYVAIYRARGIEGLKQFDWTGVPSELVPHPRRWRNCFVWTRRTPRRKRADGLKQPRASNAG